MQLSLFFATSAALGSSFAFALPNPQGATGTENGAPSQIAPSFTCLSFGSGASQLNAAACDALLNVHIPQIMDTQAVGSWSPQQSYSWDLSGYEGQPAYPAQACVLELIGVNSADPAPVSFAPSLFVTQAGTIWKKCQTKYMNGMGGQGGQGQVDGYPQFTIKISSKA